MGLAMVIGVATRIYVEKKLRFKVYSKDEILEKLKNSLNLELYDVDENEEYVIFDIKNDIFIDNIYDLLKNEMEGFRWRDENDVAELNEILRLIEQKKSVKDVEKVICEKGSYYLHMMEGNCFETISYICEDDLCIMARLLVYDLSYKVYLECYFQTFNYLRKKLRSAIDNPLKDDIFLMVTTG